MMNDVKPIYVTDTETGMEYTLEFNRDSVGFAERRGFEIDDVGKFPMSKVPELWFYAFRMHHKNVSREKTDKLLDKAGGWTAELLTRLGELYAAPFEAMSDEEKAENPPTVTIKL